MSKDKRIIMNVEVDGSVRQRFNAICDKRGLKKGFVMENIILDYITREEEADNAKGQPVNAGVGQAGG